MGVIFIYYHIFRLSEKDIESSSNVHEVPMKILNLKNYGIRNKSWG